MGEKIKFGPGVMLIGDAEQECVVTDIEYTEEMNSDIVDRGLRRLSNSFAEASLSIQMAARDFTRFVHTITGLSKDIKKLCPNRRVAHLAFHAKKQRTRAKNYKRMLRIIEKENEKCLKKF